MQTEEKVPLEDSESEDIIIADEASLPVRSSPPAPRRVV